MLSCVRGVEKLPSRKWRQPTGLVPNVGLQGDECPPGYRPTARARTQRRRSTEYEDLGSCWARTKWNMEGAGSASGS
eukprot:2979097-Amphidinium_carterae.1